jgi:hypothetical protein
LEPPRFTENTKTCWPDKIKKKKYGGDAVLKKKKTKKTCFIGHFFLK